MFVEGSGPVQSIGSEAEYTQLRSVNPNVVAEIAEPVKMPEGVLVQHYPQVSDAGMRVQLGRQYTEVESKIEWPSAHKGGRSYLQTNTGDSYVIIGSILQDLTASEAAGKPIHYQLDPEMLIEDLIGNTFEYAPGRTTGTIEMVEVSQGFSDAQGEHLDDYEMAGADPFEKFKRRFEKVGIAKELPISEASLLTDFRTYPHREPRGLRARARQMITKVGLAGKALMAEARDQLQIDDHEQKYTRHRATLVAAIGVAAIGGSMAFASGLLDKHAPSKPGRALIAPPRTPEAVMAKTGDNPWEISENQLINHGVAHPSGPEVSEYDELFLASNFPHASNLEQAAQYIMPGNRYILPNFDFKEFKR